MPERPHPGKFVIVSYELDELDFPVVGLMADPTAPGYDEPALLSTCPDPRFPNHKFTAVRPTNVDVRVMWIYELFPGPTLTTTRFDRESDIFITTTRTRNLLASITAGLAIIPADPPTIPVVTYTITEIEPIDSLTGYAIVTTIPEATAKDLASALIEEEALPYQFPARCDFSVLVNFAVPVGYREPFCSLVPHFKKTWWVVSATKPTLTYDTITYGDTIYMNNGFSLKNAIHNGVTFVYTVGGAVVFPATTPSLTTFLADWVGEQKLIRGSVTRAGSKYRWKVEAIYVVMQ